jgi:hypothetical protein
MKNQKAIVTIAIGQKYVESWKNYCQPNWQAYAHKYGYDLICLEQPLDSSSRAKLRSPAWQKCLILSQDFAIEYKTVVWIDSDILLNDKAPDVAIGVPENKVGAVDAYEFREVLVKRCYQLWPDALHSPTAQIYYRNFGLPDDVDRAVNTGVMVLSPLHHRALLESVYDNYEDKGGREWHMEQRPLSYELLKGDHVHFLDPRFNVMLPIELLTYYPFLLTYYPFLWSSRATPEKKRLLERVKRKMWKLLGDPLQRLRADCVNAVYQSSFFLHFGGTMDAIPSVPGAVSWWKI